MVLVIVVIGVFRDGFFIGVIFKVECKEWEEVICLKRFRYGGVR